VHFEDYARMLKEMEFDGCMVTSPNYTHIGQAIALYKLGIPFLLEKPVIISASRSKELLQEAKQSKGTAVIGFVLRYAPFYSKVKELIESGVIGEVMTINATESISRNLTILFNRNWRKDTDKAGPFILEKCCHDLDICNWLAGSRLIKVNSFANRSHFTAKRKPAENCLECLTKKECIYSSSFNTRKSYHGFADEKEQYVCVYNDFAHPDHQVVNLSYENGVLATFTYCWAQPEDKRTIRIMGSKGEINGDILQNKLDMCYFDGKVVKSETVAIKTDNSGHHGADSVISDTLFKVMKGEIDRSKAGIEEGVEGALASLAADRSARFGHTVYLEELRNC
jgi:predicted dehydrogenase